MSSATGDPFSSNNTVTESTVVRAVADVSVAKSDSPDPVVAGQPLTYTVTASNTGPNVAQGVVVQDTLPEGVQFGSASGCSLSGGVVSCSVGDLAINGSSQRQIVVRPTEATPALSNTATVQTSAVDTNASNDSATAVTEVREAPAPPPPPPPPPPDGAVSTPPVGGMFGGTPPIGTVPRIPAPVVAVSDHSITPRRFAPAPSGPSALAAKARRRSAKPRRYGATVSYRLNMAASVRFTVTQTVAGRTQGKGNKARCVAQTKRNRKAARCRRVVTLNGSFVMAGRAGANSFRFTGSLANKKLRRGSYTLTLTPSANGNTGKSASTSFTITK